MRLFNLSTQKKSLFALLISVGVSFDLQADEVFNAGEDIDLEVDKMIEQIISRNPQIRFSAIQKQISSENVLFEQGVYEAELFSSLTYDDSHLQRTASERLSSFNSYNEKYFDEKNTNLTLGIRKPLPTGGEFTVSYSAQEKDNNIISTAPSSNGSREYTTGLNFQYNQPLLRGRGAAVSESRIQKSELEMDSSKAQYNQQVLKAISESMTVYWQFYKAIEFLKVRELALRNAEKTLKDVELMASSGKAPEISVLDAKSNFLKKRSAYESAIQSVNEAEYRLNSLMNIHSDDLGGVKYNLLTRPDLKEFSLDGSFNDYFDTVLNNWPSSRILNNNIKMQKSELAALKNELLPTLDLNIGYKSNYLDSSFESSAVLDNEYPSWYVGIDFKMPIGGNQQMQSRKRIALLKAEQHKEDLNAVSVSLKNDLRSKLFQVKTVYEEMQSLKQSVSMLEDIFKVEQKQFEMGYTRLVDLYDREDRLNLERQRLIDAQVKYQLSKVSLGLADGSLLEKYNNLSY